MVGYAYDLGSRQADRVIEQAVRSRANVWAETIDQSQPRGISGYLISCNSEVITIQLNSTGLDSFTPITGQYYQILISLSETRYLTVSDLLEIQKKVDCVILVFSRPKNMQVLQRRKFHRHVPGQAFPVYLSWEENEELGKKAQTPALGQIKDLSMHGMCVRVPDHLDNHLFIGDMVYLRFSINVRDQELFTSATICHKEFFKDQAEMVLGLQFVGNEQNDDFHTRLRTALTQDAFNKNSKDTKKGI